MYYAFQCDECDRSWTYEATFTTCPSCGKQRTGKLIAEGHEEYAPRPFAKKTLSSEEYDTVTGCTWEALRVMSWNIERLGGDGSLGVPAQRPAEVIKAIAAVIKAAEPDVCCLIEVMEPNGATEVGRIGAELGADWTTQLPSNGFRAGEAYGLIIRKASGITCSSFTLVEKDWNGDDLYFPTVNHRRPGEALLTMPGNWTLPVLIFHAPGPKAEVQRQRDIESAIANLAKVASIRTSNDALICADLNANEEALNVVREQENFYDDEYDPDVVEEFALSLIEASTAKNAIELKVSTLTDEINERAKLLKQELENELKKVSEPLKKMKKKDRDKWEKEHIPRLLSSPAPHKQLEGEDLTQQDQADLLLFGTFEQTFPEMTLEDAQLALGAASRLATTVNEEVAKFKREVKRYLREQTDLERIENREAAWAPLILLGFLDDLRYDSTLLTTRRKNMWTALVSQGLDEEDKQEYVFLPDDLDSFSASYYDQILTLSNKRLLAPQVLPISIFAAVASTGEYETALRTPRAAFSSDDVEQDEELKGPNGSPFRTDPTPLRQPVALAHDAMKTIDVYARATQKTKQVLEGNSAELKTFVVSQAVLVRAKLISDHDPLLLAVWAKRS